MKNLVSEFDKDIKKTIGFIEADKHTEAQKFFNDIVFGKYEKEIRKKESPLVFFEIFFSELDDYLNNNSAIILGVIKKEDVLSSFYSDYQEDLKLAIKK